MKNYRAINENYRAISEKLARDRREIIVRLMRNHRATNENYRAINRKYVRFHVIGCHACCFLERKWLQQLKRYVLRSMVYFIFVKRSLSSALQYFYDTLLYESVQ